MCKSGPFNKERIEEERGRMCALFRAAFDKVDKVKMFECMRERAGDMVMWQRVRESP
jgi:hypothetical protein